MLLHRRQEIYEAAIDMRPNRFILESACNAGHRALVRRHCKVIGPKVHQAFSERPRSEGGALSACQNLSPVVGQVGIAHGIEGRSGSGGSRGFGRIAPHLPGVVASRLHFGDDLIGARQRRIPGELHRAADLRHQPAARIAGSGGQISRPGAQAKTQHGNFGLHRQTTAEQRER